MSRPLLEVAAAPAALVAPVAVRTQGAGTPVAAARAYDLGACRKLMRGGSKTFFAASLLLPARVREPASALYAFCRLADDAIDLGADPHAAMRDLEHRLDAIYDGRPGAVDADRALAQVVHRHAIPRLLLDALLEGFLWDANGRRYETLQDVHAYGARVAGTVGAMMALVMRAATPQALARACELGVAMQLTNIARDVGEDARNGRLYLPRHWLREAGIDAEAWLRAPRFDAAIAAVVERLLREADALYRRAEQGIAELPRDCRSAIHAARLVYAEIGHQLRRDGLDSIHRRTVVSGSRKLALIARATGAAMLAPPPVQADIEALPAVQFLVDSAAAALPAAAPGAKRAPKRSTVPDRSFDERVVWLIDLIERQTAQGRVLQGRAAR
ncbi:MAG: phytoene/squalene synthase family protein [Rubrivivax sp.]|nr:phytoene/squalene synthase family protein [Rubrivivax sp.]